MQAADYRARAEEMERAAERALTPEMRAEYLRMAAAWRALASAREKSAR